MILKSQILKLVDSVMQSINLVIKVEKLFSEKFCPQWIKFFPILIHFSVLQLDETLYHLLSKVDHSISLTDWLVVHFTIRSAPLLLFIVGGCKMGINLRAEKRLEWKRIPSRSDIPIYFQEKKKWVICVGSLIIWQ